MENNMIQNPILPGFNPDPCICRRGDDYYIAVSSFEWIPGLPIYHSKDLKNWRLLTHVLGNELADSFTRVQASNGIWAPCLTWCEEDGLFYMTYTIMNSMHGGCDDLNNYVVTAPDIMGPWSEPVYLHSAGFDPSMFHDDDGRKWVVCLEWESRMNHYKPGYICIVEYDPVAKKTLGLPKRILKGGSDRGWVEGPHIYKRKGVYYLLCAEGGTFYNHCTTMCRSHRVDGDYVADPANPILTATNKLNLIDPTLPLQKAGHSSVIETQNGEVYAVFHAGRPFLPEKRSPLGRETCIQKMEWSEDGWLRIAGNNGRIISESTPAPDLPECQWDTIPERNDFNQTELPIYYYAPRRGLDTFTSLTERPGYLRIHGCDSLTSIDKVSLVAKKLTSLHMTVTTKVDFAPMRYQHEAGLTLYYNNLNYFYLKKYYSDDLQSEALMLVIMEKGKRMDRVETETAVPSNQEVYLRMVIDGRSTFFYWSLDGTHYERIGDVYQTTLLSDEECVGGQGFTGTFVGMVCCDYLMHDRYADFSFLECIQNDEM
ncbi:MAG: glycoside hydrolase family 43 protein [Lachnospiraceae bacterium]